MEAYINMAEEYKVNLAPQTKEQEVIQNVRTLFSIYQGEVALSREMGLPVEIVDMPPPLAKAHIPIAYAEQLQEYEPRAEIKEITYTEKAGILIPLVKVMIKNE